MQTPCKSVCRVLRNSPCGEVVGVARFELAALRSRTVRATKLRYTPKRLLNCSQPQPRECSRSVFGGASRSPKALPKVLRNAPSCFVRSRPAFSLGEGTNLIATQTALHPEKVIKPTHDAVVPCGACNISSLRPRCQENTAKADLNHTAEKAKAQSIPPIIATDGIFP